MPSDFLKPGRDGLAFMCSGSLFQDLIVLGKNENLWLSTVEWGIGKLSFVFVLFLVFGGETSQTKSSSGSSIDLDCALWRRWSLARVRLDARGGQFRRSRFFFVLPC